MNKGELETNLLRVHEWVRAGDQKVSVFLAFQGVVLTLLLPHLISWYNFASSHADDSGIVLLITGSVLALYSLYISGLAIIPRTSHGQIKKSLLFFKDIATLDLEDYRRRLEGYNEQDYIDDLIIQTHASAKVAASKHTQFRDSVIVFSFALGIFLLGVAFTLF